MTGKRLKYLRLIAAILALTVRLGAHSQGWGDYFPSSAEGNSYSYPPFSWPLPDPGQRYQQVYRANNFVGPIIAGGVWLERIYFRADTTNHVAGLYSIVTGELQVNLSTTQKGPDSLGPVFADNVGADDTVVFGRAWLRFVLEWAPPPGPENDSFIIPVSPPFFYDPAKGNLLLDVRIFQATNSPAQYSPLPLDAWDLTNDGVSSLLSDSVNASSGTMSTVGLVTRFEGQLVPKLGFQRDTNGLTLSWTAQYNYQLQEKPALEAQSAWQSVTNGIVLNTTNFVNRLTIPFDSMGASSYFRLLYPPP